MTRPLPYILCVLLAFVLSARVQADEGTIPIIEMRAAAERLADVDPVSDGERRLGALNAAQARTSVLPQQSSVRDAVRNAVRAEVAREVYHPSRNTSLRNPSKSTSSTQDRADRAENSNENGSGISETERQTALQAQEAHRNSDVAKDRNYGRHLEAAKGNTKP